MVHINSNIKAGVVHTVDFGNSLGEPQLDLVLSRFGGVGAVAHVASHPGTTYVQQQRQRHRVIPKGVRFMGGRMYTRKTIMPYPHRTM